MMPLFPFRSRPSHSSPRLRSICALREIREPAPFVLSVWHYGWVVSARPVPLTLTKSLGGEGQHSPLRPSLRNMEG